MPEESWASHLYSEGLLQDHILPTLPIQHRWSNDSIPSKVCQAYETVHAAKTSECGQSLGHGWLFEWYLYNFNVYTGAIGERETVSREKVVLTQSESIKGRHCQLFYDIYFFSVSLLEKHLSLGTYACGMITTNCNNFPSEISEETKRESVFQQCGNVIASAWKDIKVVNGTSTLASPTELTTVKRRQKDSSRIDIHCPLCIALYKKYVGSVDQGDQLQSSFYVRLATM